MTHVRDRPAYIGIEVFSSRPLPSFRDIRSASDLRIREGNKQQQFGIMK
jgi:hypothetical protein